MSDDITLYCICRSPDIDRFMIMCDHCEEWYHGDCINITEKDSRRIKYFYCKWCRRKDPFLKTQYRKRKKIHEKDVKKSKKAKKSRESSPKPVKKKRTSVTERPRAKACKVESSYDKAEEKLANVKSLDASPYHEPFTSKLTESSPNLDRHSNSLKMIQPNIEMDNSKSTAELFHKSSEPPLSKPPNKKESVCSSKPRQEVKYPPKKKIKEEFHSYEHDLTQLNDLDISCLLSGKDDKLLARKGSKGKQCYGPGCTSAARSNSKYCSDECGEKLAARRLNLIMPSRTHQWHSTPTVANEIGRGELDRIRSAMTQARSELQSLESKFQRLEAIIERSKTFPIWEGTSDAEDNEESDHSIFCVVCGHPVSLKNAIKHMDRCYIKIESQISFGSVYPTRIEGSERLFCDVYNRQQQTYCKRLQVICPEHAKEPKIGPNEVCGCPLANDIYQGKQPTTAQDFCGRAKRKCNKHFKWESMYRASVDLQRIRQWLKIDEIFEEERRIRSAMSARAGVIPLLLHQTTAHDSQCLDMRTKQTNPKRPAYRLVI